MKIRMFFDWSDFGVGIFWDKEKGTLYLLFMPMIGVEIVL